MHIHAADGTKLHVATMGSGRALLLIHGFISTAHVNWIEFGTAKRLADAGYQLIMPDLRGHGHSDTSSSYPIDILRDDMTAVLHHFDITDYDLAGYSLGANTAVRLALSSLPPKKLIVSGMGLTGITNMMERQTWFIEAIKNRAAPKDAAGARVASFMKNMNMNAEAAIAVLQSQAQTTRADLQRLTMPTLVLSGKDDDDNGSATDLAAALPHGHYIEIPGNHMSAITTAAFGQAILAFLTKS